MKNKIITLNSVPKHTKWYDIIIELIKQLPEMPDSRKQYKIDDHIWTSESTSIEDNGDGKIKWCIDFFQMPYSNMSKKIIRITSRDWHTIHEPIGTAFWCTKGNEEYHQDNIAVNELKQLVKQKLIRKVIL